MSCYHPLTAYRSVKSGVVKIGHETADSRQLKVPCGRCFGCRMEYASVWALRCRHESTLHDVNHFVTLTYDEDSLPPTGTLEPDAVTRWLKRLRRSIGPFRYFVAGEYGEASERPHYHALLFGARLRLGSQVGEGIRESPDLFETWPFGQSSVGVVTAASCGYVAQYATKKVYGRFNRAVEARYHGRVAEFVRMSRRPGLGAGWLARYRSDLLRGYVVVDGVKQRLPRYYELSLLKNPLFVELSEERLDSWLRKQDPGEVSDERLVVREHVAVARRSNFKARRKL